MEHRANNDWVAERMSVLEPGWSPNAEWAETRLKARMEERPSRGHWLAAVAAAGVLLAIVVAAPYGRAVAQELWYRILVRSFDVVRVDASRAPLAVSITTNGMTRTAADGEEAERLAGFRPWLPAPEAMGGAPKETVVTGPVQVRQSVIVRDLRAALARAGAGGMEVPAEWDGVTLRMEIGPLVIAGYESGVQIIQTKPIHLDIPAGFPLAKLAEAVFRCMGMTWWQARAMGERYAANPSWLLDIPEDEVVYIEEVRLRTGNGLLVEDPAENGSGRVTLLFGTAERIFAVSSGSRGECLRIANLLP